jgi:hypothetical protein
VQKYTVLFIDIQMADSHIRKIWMTIFRGNVSVLFQGIKIAGDALEGFFRLFNESHMT